jgi:hypothetical protein
LSAQTSVGGTLGYAGDYTILGTGHGMVTALPAVGRVVHQGEVLYEVDGAPVVLLRGSTPAYRSLARGAEASSVRGRDVRQLNADLVALGYADQLGLDPTSDKFLWATKTAVKRLQKHLGLAQTGALALGQVVFLPTAARVTKLSAPLGGPAAGPVLSATSTTRVVSVRLDAARQSQTKVGDRVTITLPDTSTTPGVVSRVGTVATSAGTAAGSGSPTIEVTITPTRSGATGRLDQTPVQVAITTGTVRDALVVPVTALLALVGGGYAVDVVDSGATPRLVPVSLGLTDDTQGLVQVTGSGLSAGQRVTVPAT